MAHLHQMIKFPKSRLERSAPAPLQIASRTGGRKPRCHSQHRRAVIESRPRVITGQTYGGANAQISESPPVSRIKSKKLRPGTRSNFLSSASPSLWTFHDGVNSTYNIGAADVTSASTLSFCSRLDSRGCHVSISSGSSDCVEKPPFEPLSNRSVLYVQPSSLASSSNLRVAPCLAFPVSKFSAAAAGISVTPGPQISPIFLVLDSSPEENELHLCARRRTKRLQGISKCISPIILSVDGAANQQCQVGRSSSVVNTSASSSSTLKLSQEESIFHHRNYEYYLSFGFEINAIPSSPKLMFQQILKDQSCGLSPLIEAETSRCKMFHFVSLEEFGMLENLRETELVAFMGISG